jgi:hypothetical protein
VKIKFDENVSPRLVAAIRALETDKAVELGSVLHDYGAGISNPDWMFRFRDEGGVAMISGDHNILQKRVNLAAYQASGLVSIWPPHGWPNLKKWGQAALLIRWWPAILRRIEASKSGDRWRFPMHWTPGVDAFTPVFDPRIDRPA